MEGYDMYFWYRIEHVLTELYKICFRFYRFHQRFCNGTLPVAIPNDIILHPAFPRLIPHPALPRLIPHPAFPQSYIPNDENHAAGYSTSLRNYDCSSLFSAAPNIPWSQRSWRQNIEDLKRRVNFSVSKYQHEILAFIFDLKNMFHKDKWRLIHAGLS